MIYVNLNFKQRCNMCLQSCISLNFLSSKSASSSEEHFRGVGRVKQGGREGGRQGAPPKVQTSSCCCCCYTIHQCQEEDKDFGKIVSKTKCSGSEIFNTQLVRNQQSGKTSAQGKHHKPSFHTLIKFRIVIKG